MGVGDQQRAVRCGARRGELVGVDELHPRLDGIDAEARPRDVEERHRRQDLDVDAVVAKERLHAALEHHGRSRHGVEDLSVDLRGADELLDDRAVDVVEAVGLLVELVERRRRVHEMSTGMSARAEVAVRDTFDRRQRLDGDVLVATRPEPDDNDLRSPRHRATTERSPASQRP